MTCHFCQSEAEGACCWPVAMAAGWIRLHMTIAIGSNPERLKYTGDQVTRDVLPGWMVRVRRPAQCGNLVCAEHGSERGPGVHHCQAHWFAWEAVAA